MSKASKGRKNSSKKKEKKEKKRIKNSNFMRRAFIKKPSLLCKKCNAFYYEHGNVLKAGKTSFQKVRSRYFTILF